MSGGGASAMPTGTTQLWKTNDARAKKSGPHATVFWTNANTYAGEWRDNKKDGRGTFTCKDKKWLCYHPPFSLPTTRGIRGSSCCRPVEVLQLRAH